MNFEESEGPVVNPVFPDIAIHTATSRVGQKAVVITCQSDEGEVNYLVSPKMAIDVAKGLMAGALDLMDQEEIEEMEGDDMIVFRASSGEVLQ